jgi:hypothetical protein
VQVRVTADPPGAIEAPVATSSSALPASVEIRTRSGSATGTLRVEVRGAFCDIDTGPGAACRLAESAFVQPFTLEPGGRTRLTLE